MRGWLDGLRKGWGSGPRPAATPRESDVAQDAAVAGSRPAGGERPGEDRPGDEGTRGSTTGSGPSGRPVGRVAGEDAGDVGESGAEARGER
ncbi:hypothetical protein H9Y04_09410 [Streptomyces sp. TRM66268-LWL]|uniref:Uncharacterized protein n=1 Tax=Streptomyces polyasparticus TaxID=2767826 RepID=A0ABR7SC88_9ACTN|nr:hypothetical protein [Streptomyces polyasparticus]